MDYYETRNRVWRPVALEAPSADIARTKEDIQEQILTQVRNVIWDRLQMVVFNQTVRHIKWHVNGYHTILEPADEL